MCGISVHVIYPQEKIPTARDTADVPQNRVRFCIRLRFRALILGVRKIDCSQDSLDQDEDLVRRLLDLLEGIAYIVMCAQLVVDL